MSRILVVDNEKSMREMLSIALKKEGYEVETARNGEVAVEMVEGSDYDVVITDINMPNINGLELVNFIKKNPQYRDTPCSSCPPRAACEIRKRV